PATVIAPPKEAPKKARRGRSPKRNASATRSVAESSGSSASASTLASPFTNLPEFDLVLKAMSLKVRPSTTAACTKPLEVWQASLNVSKYVATRSIIFMLYCHSN
ncbi:hypothetical protein PS6_011727, partial [Mucor atramentarius]